MEHLLKGFGYTMVTCSPRLIIAVAGSQFIPYSIRSTIIISYDIHTPVSGEDYFYDNILAI